MLDVKTSLDVERKFFEEGNAFRLGKQLLLPSHISVEPEERFASLAHGASPC